MPTIAMRTTTATEQIGEALKRALRVARDAPLPALFILTSLMIVAVFADAIAPHEPTFPVKGAKMFAPPFWMEGGNLRTPLGTDFQSRDILS
ncbi:MAG: hypothetical protein ACREOH_10720, partial [Candidatus Entotheonellia bacterium]